jgi:hypothetical protein
MGHIDERLVLQVRLLAQPCLWCWEIHATAADRLVESSWASEWVAFASRQDAAAAGARRLAELERIVSLQRRFVGTRIALRPLAKLTREVVDREALLRLLGEARTA